MELTKEPDIGEDVEKRAKERALMKALYQRIPHLGRVKPVRAIDLVVMVFIKNATYPRIADLVKELGMGQSEASDVVQILVDRGRVKRTNALDGRERYLELTPKGARLLKTARLHRTRGEGA